MDMWITQPLKIFGQGSVHLGMLPKFQFQMLSYPMFQLCISSKSGMHNIFFPLCPDHYKKETHLSWPEKHHNMLQLDP